MNDGVLTALVDYLHAQLANEVAMMITGPSIKSYWCFIFTNKSMAADNSSSKDKNASCAAT